MPRKVRRSLRTICFGKGTVSKMLRLAVFLAVLVTMGGDVELNPGPRSMKQRTLPFGDESVDGATNAASQERGSKSGKATKDSEVMSFLREMKSEMKTDLSDINSKITNINESLNVLREENDTLKRENREMREELSVLSTKLDKLEAHSRRNNLRFLGIQGRVNESWEETETALRKFLTDELHMTNSDSIQIERAHRIGGRYAEKCTIIAKFTTYKDREDILRKARNTLQRETGFMVKEDYTDRVLLHRRELGKKLVEARESGQYASMRYDKLVIDGNVYKYCDQSEQIILIGAARGRPRQYNRSTNVNSSVRQRGNRLDDQADDVDLSHDHVGLADESVFEDGDERGAIGGVV